MKSRSIAAPNASAGRRKSRLSGRRPEGNAPEAAGAQNGRTHRRSAEIINAAAHVFAERGYHGATTQDIADVLGIRQASLYYYFSSKEAALEAVCAEGMEDYALRAQRILKDKASAANKVGQLVFHHLAPMAERHDFT